MNKPHIVIVHGWEGTPRENWFPWLARELRNRGYRVTAPALPDTNHPTVEKWVPALAKAVGEPTENTYLIGHSLGVITILRYLETIDTTVGGVVMVAGFGKDLTFPEYHGELSSFFAAPIDWDTLKSRARHYTAIQSDNDHLVDGSNLGLLEERLGAKAMLVHRYFHFGAEDGISDLAVARDALLDQISA
jgi:predicted alpha/beta hydrolase family esterase